MGRELELWGGAAAGIVRRRVGVLLLVLLGVGVGGGAVSLGGIVGSPFLRVVSLTAKLVLLL